MNMSMPKWNNRSITNEQSHMNQTEIQHGNSKFYRVMSVNWSSWACWQRPQKGLCSTPPTPQPRAHRFPPEMVHFLSTALPNTCPTAWGLPAFWGHYCNWGFGFTATRSCLSAPLHRIRTLPHSDWFQCSLRPFYHASLTTKPVLWG